MVKEIYMSGHNYSLERKKSDQYKFTLGNWTDAGWHWDGKTADALGFLIRIANSKIDEDFIKDAEESKLTLKEMKPVLKKALSKYDGLYELSGDNNVWHFGNSFDEIIYEPDEVKAYVEAGYSEETAKEIVEEKLSNVDIDYDKFKKQYKEVYKKEMDEILKSSNSFKDLFAKLNEERFEVSWIENVQSFATDQYIEAPAKALQKKQVRA